MLGLFRGVSDPFGGGQPGPSSVVRFTPDGSFDPNFGPGWYATEATLPQDDARVLAPRADGSVLVGTTTRLVRVNENGRADADALGGVAGLVLALLVSTDDSILVGGSLQFDQPEPWCHLVRRLADGRPDATFPTVVASLNGDPRGAVIQALARDNQGRLLVGGAFDVIQGASRWALARLNPDGGLDTGFGGNLQAEGRVARLNADASLDTLLDPNGTVATLVGQFPGASINRVLAEPDGRVVIGGRFNRLNGQAAAGIARLNGGAAFGFVAVHAATANRLVLEASTPLAAEVRLEASSDLRS